MRGMRDMLGGVRRVVCSFVVVCAALSAAAQEIRTVVVVPDGTRLATDVYLPLAAAPGRGRSCCSARRTARTASSRCAACSTSGVRVRRPGRARHRGVDRDRHGVPRRRAGRSRHHRLGHRPVVVERPGRDVRRLGARHHRVRPRPGASAALKCQVPVVATADFYHHAAYQGGALREALVYNWLDGQDNLAFFERDPPAPAVRRLVGRRPRSCRPRRRSTRPASTSAAGTTSSSRARSTRSPRSSTRAAPARWDGRSCVIGPWTHTGTAQLEQGELDLPRERRPRRLHAVPRLARPLAQGDQACGRELAGGARLRDGRGRRERAPRATPGSTSTTGRRRPGPSRSTSTPAGGLRRLPGDRRFDDLDRRPRRPGADARRRRALRRPRRQRPADGGGAVRPAADRGARRRRRVHLLVPRRAGHGDGARRLHLWVRPDTPDLDLAVRLVDVYPDGRAMLVTDCDPARPHALRRRPRVLPRARTSRPRSSSSCRSTAIVFNVMHRIRIDVSGSNWPRFEVNPNDGGDLNLPTAGVVAHPVLLFGSTPRRASSCRSSAPRAPPAATSSEDEQGDEDVRRQR